MKTIEERLKALEEAVAELTQSRQVSWVRLATAAKSLDVATETLRREIKRSIKDPKATPFKKGVHWRQIGRIYQIHLKRWEEICEK